MGRHWCTCEPEVRDLAVDDRDNRCHCLNCGKDLSPQYLRGRITELEAALQAAKEAEARAMALALSHQGAIERLAAKITELEAERGVLTIENAALRAVAGLALSATVLVWDDDKGAEVAFQASKLKTALDNVNSDPSPLTAAIQAVVEAARRHRAASAAWDGCMDDNDNCESLKGDFSTAWEAFDSAVDHLNSLLHYQAKIESTS